MKIYLAGHRGMVGTAIYKELKQNGYSNIITRTSKVLDLRNQKSVNTFISDEKPDVVIIAAARVGGILANNTYPYQFLYDNLTIQNNIISASHNSGVQKLIFLGSSCIYPKHAPQPIKEEHLLTSPLEPTNQWYAIAKIAGLKACEALRVQYDRHYISLMPNNLYGPNDNFDLDTSHVLPAMIRKFHDAKPDKPVTLWGTGKPKREFLHVEDLARAVVFAFENNLSDTLYNVGIGKDISIKELAEWIQRIVGHSGEIIWDLTKPDGTPRKLLDVSKLHSAGWKHQIELSEGIQQTYKWFVDNYHNIKELKINN